MMMTPTDLPAPREAVATSSVVGLAQALLAFREAHAPDNPRFYERALLLDNGGRGSDQKAIVFTVDDLSALMQDHADLLDEVERLRYENERLTSVVIPHARKQENANGFQRGWHAALSRTSEGDAVSVLAALVPEPSFAVEIPVCKACADLAAAQARIAQLSEHHAFEVVDPVGGSVAAPCAIEGCRYDTLQADLAAAKAVLESVGEVEDYDDGFVDLCLVDRAAWLAWQGWQR